MERILPVFCNGTHFARFSVNRGSNEEIKSCTEIVAQ